MKIRESFLRDILRLFIWFPFRWSVRNIPVALAFFIFKLIGDVHFLIDGKKRRKLSRIISQLLHRDTTSSLIIVRKYLEMHYLDRLHIFLYPELTSREKLRRYVRIENVDVLEKAYRTGRGILLVQPHFGPIQITLLSLALDGYNPIQIGFPTDRGLSKIGRSVAYKYRLKYEAMLPAPIIPADRYLGRAYKHLVTGGIVLTTGDGAGGGVFLGEQRQFRFLDMERKFPLGPAAWSIRTGAAYIPAFIVPETYRSFKIILGEPIQARYNNQERDKIHVTEQFIDTLEAHVRRYPYCWHFWDEL